ncbi:putative fimbriae; major subunit [Klebsiella aerogenes]|nr:putative fimbriae; major subunit [Klebsiella aerogenes]
MSAANAASTGTITFNGELTDTTCDVDVNGQGADATVTLPTVSINQLTKPGNTAGRTSFNMNLSNCVIGTVGGHSKVAAFFQPGDTVDLSTGRLKNVGGDATMVDLQLLGCVRQLQGYQRRYTDQVNDMTYVDIKKDGTACCRMPLSTTLTARPRPVP